MKNFTREDKLFNLFLEFSKCESLINNLPKITLKEEREQILTIFNRFKESNFNYCKLSNRDVACYQAIRSIQNKIESERLNKKILLSVFNVDFMIDEDQFINYIQRGRKYKRFEFVTEKLNNFLKGKTSDQRINGLHEEIIHINDLILKFVSVYTKKYMLSKEALKDSQGFYSLILEHLDNVL